MNVQQRPIVVQFDSVGQIEGAEHFSEGTIILAKDGDGVSMFMKYHGKLELLSKSRKQVAYDEVMLTAMHAVLHELASRSDNPRLAAALDLMVGYREAK